VVCCFWFLVSSLQFAVTAYKLEVTTNYESNRQTKNRKPKTRNRKLENRNQKPQTKNQKPFPLSRKIPNNELNRLNVDEFKSSPKMPFMILLDNVRSMNNIGSVFRTADAFRCSAVGLFGITATPPHREIHKTALGAEESVEWFYEKDISSALNRLKEDGYTIAAIEQVEGNISLDKFFPVAGKKYAFIFGHEMNGVSEEALGHCDMFIEIPQQGTKHSLNIAVAVGIVAWHFILKIEK
jgi:23S rRNA (guanosine2251-2'-O)-methyltransferase